MFKRNLAGVILALILLGVGIFIGTKLPRKIAMLNGAKTDSFQAGWDAAKERLKQSPLGMGAFEQVDVRSISGEIKKIEGNKITIKINPLEPLADPSLDERVIVVDSNTKIKLAIQRDPQQVQKEMRESLSGAQQPQSNLPPNPYEYGDISLSDLKENQTITVTSSENIKDKKEFNVVKIDAQEFPAPTFAPTPMPLIDPVVSAPAQAEPKSVTAITNPTDNAPISIVPPATIPVK